MEAKQRQLLGAGIIALALFLVWVLVIPGFREIRAFRAAVIEREVLVVERANLIDYVSNLESEYRQSVTDARKFSAVVPASRGTAELISALEKMAQVAGVQMVELNISDEKGEKEKYATVAIVLKGSGTYESVLGFLDNFEKNIRLIDVQTLEIGEDEFASGLLVFGIKATAYSLK